VRRVRGQARTQSERELTCRGGKHETARRVNRRCPSCGTPTSGPQRDPTKSINVGVAGHITAAALGGPRFDNSLTPRQRVVTKEGERGTLEGITTVGTHAAYIVALDGGQRRMVYATDLELDTPDQDGVEQTRQRRRETLQPAYYDFPKAREGEHRSERRKAYSAFLESESGQRAEIENSRLFKPKFKAHQLEIFDHPESHLDRLRAYFNEPTLNEWLELQPDPS
jgi:hypothetical protein